MSRNNLDAEYYQSLHDNHPAFQNNNWMTQDLEALKALGGNSLLELGCGNGRFLDMAAAHWSKVVGIDWARSPVLDDVLARNPGVSFVQGDILTWTTDETFDLVVSADFLEHLPPDSLVDALRRFHRFGGRHYHRIACYDDGHSHLSIHAPETWLELFAAVAPDRYALLSCEARKGNPDKLVITIGSVPA